MGRLFGFMGLLAVVAVGAYLYSREAQSVVGGTNAAAPKATVNVVGVRSDLLTLANAERGHFALEGKYASLEELKSSRSIATIPNRSSCSYDALVSGTSFTITATCPAPEPSGRPAVFRIDETMQVHSE